jgi:hypothetical protein
MLPILAAGLAPLIVSVGNGTVPITLAGCLRLRRQPKEAERPTSSDPFEPDPRYGEVGAQGAGVIYNKA